MLVLETVDDARICGYYAGVVLAEKSANHTPTHAAERAAEYADAMLLMHRKRWPKGGQDDRL